VRLLVAPCGLHSNPGRQTVRMFDKGPSVQGFLQMSSVLNVCLYDCMVASLHICCIKACVCVPGAKHRKVCMLINILCQRTERRLHSCFVKVSGKSRAPGVLEFSCAGVCTLAETSLCNNITSDY
jgi:hypothetical protein